MYARYTAFTPASLALRPGADHFQTGDTDVSMHQRDYSWLSVTDVRRVADVPGRKHLRSAVSSSLAIPATRRSTIGDRAFVVAAAFIWNKLPLPHWLGHLIRKNPSPI